ncbi:MAG: alpha/beta hydrolase [Rubrivivax sp.]|nr:alpha/beta hydrolase [Rubrivivax sp.]MDH5339365.1 alpha/beta hydrolase [Rubrivivax sp.]
MKVMGTALWIGLVCMALLAAIYLWQERLLYFPARVPVEQMAHGGLRAWPSGPEFRGLVAEPEGAVRGTAIVFHGNAGHAGHRAFYARALVPQGWRVILAEYPGYGPRAGRLGEASLVSDAGQTVALVHRQYGGPVLLVGESLGAAVAAAAGARHADLTAGLILITPWDRLARVASHHYPWLPVKWLLRDRYDTTQALARFDRPVVVAVAERDTIVPANLGAALHADLGEPKLLVVIKGSGHNDWPDRVDTRWWRAALTFAQGGPQ